MHKKQGQFLSIIHNLQLFSLVFIICPGERKVLTIYGQVFPKLRTAQKFGPFKMVLSSCFSGILRRFYKTAVTDLTLLRYKKQVNENQVKSEKKDGYF